MVNKVLYVSLDTYNKNMFFVINYETHKYKIRVSYKVIITRDFNILFIYLLKYYIWYIIGI